MGTRYLFDLADVCRYSGYPVIEVDDWHYRARNSGGYEPDQPGHLVVHHTASGPSSDGWPDVNYCCYGNSDSPIGNLYLARDGTVYVMAGGAANTNGSGQDPCGLVPDDGMNSRSIAIEAGNDGVGEPWPEAQQDSYRRLCRALCTAYGIDVAQLHSHFEWTPRKIDPAGPSAYATGSSSWNMTAFRADVANLHEPEPGPTPPEEDDVLRKVLVPKVAGNPGWWPYLACFDSGIVRPLSGGDPPPLDGQAEVTDIGQYRRQCHAANIQLETELP